MAEAVGVVGATELGVVVFAESKIKQTNKNWVMLNMCSVLTLNPDKLGVYTHKNIYIYIIFSNSHSVLIRISFNSSSPSITFHVQEFLSYQVHL